MVNAIEVMQWFYSKCDLITSAESNAIAEANSMDQTPAYMFKMIAEDV